MYKRNWPERVHVRPRRQEVLDGRRVQLAQPGFGWRGGGAGSGAGSGRTNTRPVWFIGPLGLKNIIVVVVSEQQVGKLV